MRLNPLLRISAIALVTLSSGIACQQSTETVTPDEPTAAPADTADEGAVDAKPAPETEAPPATTSPAEPPATADEAEVATANQSCSVSAFVADTDPAGLNVRSGPGSDFAAIATLPTDEPVEVSIVGASDGWFLINEAYSGSQQELGQLGWVYAPLLGVVTTSLDINNVDAPAQLYATPDGNSNVKTEVPKSTTVTLLSCSGNWLQVQAGDASGWLAVGDQCSDPLGNCP